MPTKRVRPSPPTVMSGNPNSGMSEVAAAVKLDVVCAADIKPRGRSLAMIREELAEALDVAIEHDRETTLGRIARHAVRHLGWELYKNHIENSSARSDFAWTAADRTRDPNKAIDIVSKRWDGIGSWDS